MKSGFESLEILDYLSIALVKSVRPKIINQEDYAMALDRLLKLPKLSDITPIIEAAYRYKGINH